MVLIFDDPCALYSPPDDDFDLHEVYNRSAVPGYHGRGIALDEEEGLAASAPPVTAWHPLTDVTTVSITVDRAREQSCQQAQREIDFIKVRAQTVLCIQQETPFSKVIEVITEEFFGETSRLFRCFADEIPAMRGQHKLFQRCMGTFFWCCIQDESLKEMHSSNSISDASNMATEAEYNMFWRYIHNADYQYNCNNESHRIEVPFWRKVETALNSILRRLFVTGMEGRMQVTIDDDKVHYHITRIAKDFEPKPKQHVRDN
jgi:hypothetical protein